MFKDKVHHLSINLVEAYKKKGVEIPDEMIMGHRLVVYDDGLVCYTKDGERALFPSPNSGSWHFIPDSSERCEIDWERFYAELIMKFPEVREYASKHENH